MRNPYEWEPIVWALSSFSAFCGSFFGWYNRFRLEKRKTFKFFEFIGECLCGVVVGQCAHILCISQDYDAGNCLACAAVGGALSSRVFRWLNTFADSKIKAISGLEHHDKD